MLSKNKKEKKKADVGVWVLFTSVLLIIVFFLWYFFIYVNGNEKSLIQKNFRVLTQLAENFKNRYEGLGIVVKSPDMKKGLEHNVDIEKFFFGIDTIGIGNKIDNTYIYLGKDSSLNFRIKKQEFFQPLERKDVFEQIIVIKKDSITDKNELFYTSFPGDIVVKNLDSLITDSRGLSSGTIADVSILGVDYKLFLTNAQLPNNESYYVGGVMTKDEFNKEIRSINFYIALLIIIIFFIFLLSIPLIKLKVISENQKLSIKDLLSSTLSIIVGSFFVLLIIFSFIIYIQVKDKVNTSLKVLSNSIYTSLTNEIAEIDSTLDDYSNSLISKKAFNPDSSSYKYFKLIFKLNPNGDQDTITTSRSTKSYKGNYKYRRYFSESGEWELKGKKLMLDYIYSNTSGEQLGVVSIRKGDFVYVVTSRLYSVINTILPPGYGFCVIDDKGDVKFHSDANRMLRENFLQETGNPGELTSAIYGRLELHFNTKYLGQNHSCYIRPLSTLPLYLITFFDNSYSNSINLEITSVIILFLSLLLFMFFITVIGARLFVYKRSYLLKNNDMIEWLRPADWKMEIYRRMTIANIIAVILIASSCLTAPGNTLFITFLFIIIQIIAVFYSVNMIAGKSLHKKYLKRQFILPIFFILCIYYMSFRAEANFIILVIYSVLMILSDFAVIAFFRLRNSESGRPLYFYQYLFSWLSLLVTVPVIIFSIIFFNYEINSELKHNVYSYADNKAARNYEIDKFYHDYKDSTFYQYKDENKLKGIYYLYGINRSTSDSFTKANEDSTSGKLDKIMFYLKPDLDQLSSERKGLGYSNKYFASSSDSIILKYPGYQTHYSVKNHEGDSYYAVEKSEFGSIKPEVFVLFSLILILFFYTIYKLIVFTSERIFGISIKKREEFSYLLNQHLKSGNNLIIYSPDTSRINLDNYLSENYSMEINYEEVQPDYFISNPGNEKDPILIKNINIDFEQIVQQEEKFSNIIRLSEKDENQLIVILNQSLTKLITDIKAKIKSEKDETSLKQLNNINSMLNALDKRFVHLCVPVNGTNNRELNEFLSDKLNKVQIADETKELIKNELTVLGLHEDSVKKYAEIIIDYVEKEKSVAGNLNEKIILRMQEMAAGYYEQIWESCSNEEKLLLIDIAENLLLNDKNDKVIKSLINKGLLRKNISIELLNRSFRNYINTKSEADYEKEYLGEIRKPGKWANYRAPILLIILAIGFFLVLQENILTSIASILPVVLSIITVITKVSGIFSRDNVATVSAEK